MKKLFAALAASAALCAPLPAMALEMSETPQSNTTARMGCMKLKECTEGVHRVENMQDVIDVLGDRWVWTDEHEEDFGMEMIALFDRLNAAGVKVYLAEGYNFPRTHRGSYYTDTNEFYLNAEWVKDPAIFMLVMRHEGWHAAQDCMAGTLDNTMIAVIHLPEDVPQRYQTSAEIRYGMFAPKAIPWEAEAIWAGNTPMMTADALNACASGPMWEEYEPTPLTREWLESNGYIK